MSYRIDYDPEKSRIYPTAKRGKHKWLIISLAVVTAIFALQKLDGQGYLKSWLLPGNPEVTSAALTSMFEDVQQGEPVGQAVTAFCLKIIHNG